MAVIWNLPPDPKYFKEFVIVSNEKLTSSPELIVPRTIALPLASLIGVGMLLFSRDITPTSLLPKAPAPEVPLVPDEPSEPVAPIIPSTPELPDVPEVPDVPAGPCICPTFSQSEPDQTQRSPSIK